MSIIDRLKALLAGADGPARVDGPPGSTAEMAQCHEALQAVHDFLDGELDGASYSRVERHFAVCQKCYPHLRFEAAFKDAVRRAAAGCEAPEGLKSKVKVLLDEARAEG